ncbi:MAG TPA: 7-cyano-7-deazaguanine synthase, partial [Candidatus Acidoferrales bacterium]|nr:7-cyano-7-deazaguanine synthase [Candidatus Acidoferrales bacterium]
ERNRMTMGIADISDRGNAGIWPGESEVRESIGRRGSKVVVLASGGLDSCVLIACIAQIAVEVQPLFVRNGHPWEDAESAALQRFVKAFAAPNILPVAERSLPLRDLLEVHWHGHGYQPGFSEGYRANFIPGRNLALLSVGSLYAYVHGASAVALGLLAGNPYPDATPGFFSTFEKLFGKTFGRPLEILTPFAKLSKEEVVRAGESFPLELTLSCVNPIDGEHCGNACNKCAERQKGFALAGIVDRTTYRNTPPQVNWKTHKWPD